MIRIKTCLLVWGWPSLAFLMLNLVDCALSQAALNAGLFELNPLWREGRLWLKLAPALFVAYAFRRRRTVMLVLTTIMSLVVTWNLVILVIWQVS